MTHAREVVASTCNAISVATSGSVFVESASPHPHLRLAKRMLDRLTTVAHCIRISV